MFARASHRTINSSALATLLLLLAASVFVDDSIWCARKATHSKKGFYAVFYVCTERALRFTVIVGFFAFFLVSRFCRSFSAPHAAFFALFLSVYQRSVCQPLRCALALSTSILCVFFWFLACLDLCCVRVFSLFESHRFFVFTSVFVWEWEWILFPFDFETQPNIPSVIWLLQWMIAICFNVLFVLCVVAINAAQRMSSVSTFNRIKYQLAFNVYRKYYSHKLIRVTRRFYVV